MQVRDYLKLGVVQNAVNLPSLTHEEYVEIAPYIDMAERLGLFPFALHAGKSGEHPDRLCGTAGAGQDRTHPQRSTVRHPRQHRRRLRTGTNANRINAAALAEERGIRIQEEKEATSGGSGNTLKLVLHSSVGDASASATVLHGNSPRLLSYNGIDIEAALHGTLLVFRNRTFPESWAASGPFWASTPEHCELRPWPLRPLSAHPAGAGAGRGADRRAASRRRQRSHRSTAQGRSNCQRASGRAGKAVAAPYKKLLLLRLFANRIKRDINRYILCNLYQLSFQ